MAESLSSYPPEQDLGPEVIFDSELEWVVNNLRRRLEPEQIWELFASSPRATGGKIRFPYCRVDSSVGIASEALSLIVDNSCIEITENEWYKMASKNAFRALLWVEVGFEGLDNLAVSSASRSWTSAVGHSVSDEERTERIKKEGREMYQDCLRRFIEFRKNAGITYDIFTQNGAEDLLGIYKKED